MNSGEIESLAKRTLYLEGEKLNEHLGALIKQCPDFVQAQMDRFPRRQEDVILALQAAYGAADGKYSPSFTVLRNVAQMGVEKGIDAVKKYVAKAKKEGL